MNILLGVTGSVAAKLTSKLVKSIHANENAKWINIAITNAANQFLEEPGIYFYDDDSEWELHNNTGKVVHIELTRSADVFVIAPCTANTLSKIAVGICDNLLTSCVRAWPLDKKMIIVPAMNTQMWNHHITRESIDKIKSFSDNIIFVEPQEKTLYCGDTGMGAMASIDDIVKEIFKVK